MNDPVERKMQPHRLLASFFLGISVTLLMTSPPALSGVYSVSPGWMGLWLVATVACISLGAMLLLGLPWRELPIDVRRGPGLAYLTSAGVNLLALAVLVVSLGGQGAAIVLAIFAGLGLAFLYLRLYAMHPEKSEDLFP